MRKNVFGRQLKRDTNERKALFKSLASSLVLSERIETTEAKAKAVRGHIDKLVSQAKRSSANPHARLQLYLNQQAIGKFISDVVPRFKNRTSGYTRMVRVRRRLADGAPMVLLQWVEGQKHVEREKPSTRAQTEDLKVQSPKEETSTEGKQKKIQAKKSE